MFVLLKGVIMNTTNIKSVDGTRGLACLMVLLSHQSLMFYPYLHSGKESDLIGWFDYMIYHLPFSFLFSGTGAVYIFFVLSGFILTYACMKNGDPLNAASKMLVARYIRLGIPVFFSIVLTYFALSFLGSDSVTLPWISSFTVEGKTFSQMIFNATFGSIILGDSSFNWVIWTMQIEFYGSVIVFLLAPFLITIRGMYPACLIAAFIISIYFPNKLGYGYASFLIGIYLYKAKNIGTINAYVMFVIGLLLCGYSKLSPIYDPLRSVFNHALEVVDINYYYFFNMIGGVLIVTSIVKSKILCNVFEHKIVVWLGKVSFSAYLLQMMVFSLFTTRIMHYLTESGMSYGASAFISCASSTVLIYALAHVFYKVIDKKGAELAKRITLKMVATQELKGA